MAYTIVKSDGTVLTTIADGTINTTSTSLGLPGRNYAGYGQALDTNFVHVLENFADNTPPANPLRGQLWYNTNDNTLRVCPEDGQTIASEWLILASTSSSGTTTFGGVTVNGDLAVGNNATITNTLTVTDIDSVNISVSGGANISTANIGNTFTSFISTGAASNPGELTGTWTLSSGSTLQATYADLAERFAADTELSPGTVVELGGRKEIRAVRYELSEDVFGVISNTAAYLMNARAGTDKTHPAVAMSGRVKVKVVGKVVKGQRLVSAGEGCARAAKDGEANAFNTIGRALEDKLTTELGTVEAIVIIR
jgi:hypothetical protein